MKIFIELDSFLNIIDMSRYIFTLWIIICIHFGFFLKKNVNVDNKIYHFVN